MVAVRRHSTTGFSENVVAAETSHLMLEVLSFYLLSSGEGLTFLVK